MKTKLPLGVILFVAVSAVAQQPSLKDAYKSDFKIGVAMNTRQILETDTVGDAIVKAQFNSISPENILKWEVVHPQPEPTTSKPPTPM